MNRENAMSSECISQLEHQVRRWRLVSLCLVLLLILAVAVGVIFTTIPATRESGGFWSWLPWVAREKAAREEVLRAREEEMRALRAVEAQRRAAEAKRAEDEAANNKGP